jgi:hypothetical protein
MFKQLLESLTNEIIIEVILKVGIYIFTNLFLKKPFLLIPLQEVAV